MARRAKRSFYLLEHERASEREGEMERDREIKREGGGGGGVDRGNVNVPLMFSGRLACSYHNTTQSTGARSAVDSQNACLRTDPANSRII